jgi:hypothetical protein
MSVAGRTTPDKRREAREARAVKGAPPPPKVDGQFVEITGSAKVDVDDPIAGRVATDHEGAVGELEGAYYNAERQEHMGRVRVGQKADGSGGQLRGIPLNRLKGVRAETKKPETRSRFGPLNISQDRWDEIFGKKEKK